MGTYKAPSDKAKYAYLKRDILGDGLKESKLEKYAELKNIKPTVSEFIEKPTNYVNGESVLIIVDDSSSIVGNLYLEDKGVFERVLESGDIANYVQDNTPISVITSGIEIDGTDLSVPTDYTYVAADTELSIATINEKSASSTVVKYEDGVTDKTYNVSVDVLVLKDNKVTDYSYRSEKII